MKRCTPLDWIICGNEPDAPDWNVRGEAKKQEGTLWTGASGGLRSQDQPPTWTGSCVGDKIGKKAGPLDWSILGAADRIPGLEHPGKKASSPGMDHPGLNNKEEPKTESTNWQGKQQQDPKEWRRNRGESRWMSQRTQDHPGATGQEQEDLTSNEEGVEEQDKRVRGRKTVQGKKEKPRRMKDHAGERAKRPGLEHPRWRPRNKKAASCIGTSGADPSSRRAHDPDGGGASKGQQPGLDHPGKTKGAKDQSPGLEHPGRKASSPGLDYPAWSKKEGPKGENN